MEKLYQIKDMDSVIPGGGWLAVYVCESREAAEQYIRRHRELGDKRRLVIVED